MNSNEIGTFSKKLAWAASVQSKSVGKTEAENMFEFLVDLPINAVLQGIERALKKRDPDDVFEKSTLLSGVEIRRAAEEIIEAGGSKEKTGPISGCKPCDGTGWLTNEDEKGRLVAHPCECLYNVAKEALARKKRIGSQDADMDKFRRQTVGAYEHHEKVWGTTPKAKEERP